MRPSPTRHRTAVVLSLLGAIVSTVTLVVHQRLASGTGYTSFCNLGGIVNCDAVLGSRYAEVLGVPVAAWGLLTFVAGSGLALFGAVGGGAGGIADLLLLGVASWSLGFAVVMAAAMVSIGAVCLLCLATDAVIVAWFLTVLPLASGFESGADSGWWRRPAAARGIAGAALVLAIAGGTWAAVRTPGMVRTVEEVRTRDPKFYSWYTKRPVRPVSELTNADCHRKGGPDAVVAIVEFSDFQCPYCVQAFRDLRDLLRARPEISLVFRHYPLDATCNTHMKRTVHPDACLAACAAECAGRQGRFWEYHDVLFENNEHLERDSLLRYASDMHLDLAAFQVCIDDPSTRARVGQDVEAAARAGVNSTPTLFFNGRFIEGALDRTYYDYALIIERHHAGHVHGGEGAS